MEKIKVMIVDDEHLQRELVKASVCYEELGMKIVAEAEDGKTALRLFRECNPDIVIMDINIPFINGIEVSRTIKRESPQTQVLILTAYGEFDYAKDALNLGAAAFVLKPLDAGELYEKLIQAKKQIEETAMLEKKLTEYKQEKRQMGKEQFLLEVLSGLANGENMKKRCEKYGIDCHDKICILDIRFENRDVKEKAQEEIEEYIREQIERCEAVHVEKDLLMILMGKGTEEELQVKVCTLYNGLNENTWIRGKLIGGFSNIHKSIERLPAAYREAYSMMNRQNFGSNTGKSFRRYETQSLNLFIEHLSYESEDFLRCMRSRNAEEICKRAEAVFDRLDQGNYAREQAVYIAMDLLVNAASYLMECGVDIAKELEHEHEIIAELSSAGKTGEIKDIVLSFLKRGVLLLNQSALSSGSRKAQEARKFIEENYYLSELSLNVVAEETGVNPCYLSNLFKQEFGLSLSRYIIKTRLENAVAYMKEEPNATLGEISLEVGYADVYYFSKSFKNYYGISPSQFMRENTGRKN